MDILRLYLVDSGDTQNRTPRTERLARLFAPQSAAVLQGLAQKAEGKGIDVALLIAPAQELVPRECAGLSESIPLCTILTGTDSETALPSPRIIHWHENDEEMRYALFLVLLTAWFLKTGSVVDTPTTLWLAGCVGLTKGDLMPGWQFYC